MSDADEPKIVIWEERVQQAGWAFWCSRLVPLVALVGGLAYIALSLVPIPLVYRVLAVVALVAGAAMLTRYARRTAARRPGRITLDFERRRFYAENLLVERGFWPLGSRTALYECGFDEIRSVRLRLDRHSRMLWIDLSGGQILIGDLSTGFDELVNALGRLRR